MSDLIDREAAIDAMMKLQTEDIEAYGVSIPEGFDGDRAVTALKALPSAQPRWIPCCTALPKENGYYLTTTMYNAVCLDYWNTDNFDRTEIVLAWMPLPTPWEGEQNERFD